MMGLLLVRDKIKNFYGEHEFIVMAVLKFLLVLIGLLLIKFNIGYMEEMQKVPVMIAVALVSAFLPVGLTLVVLAAVILLNIYALSVQLAVVSLGILLVMFILYYRFNPSDGILLIMIPMMFFLKIPYMVPLAVGLLCTPVSIVAVSFGTIVYYMIHLISANAATINNMREDDITSQIEYFINLFIEDRIMMSTIGIFLIVIIVVYFIRRMSINNSWTTAITIGGILELILFIVSSLVLKNGESPVFVVLGCVVSVIIAFVLQFFVFSVDYSRTEHTQFEDDEYYYYVKAVPKINVAAPEMNIKRINAKRNKK